MEPQRGRRAPDRHRTHFCVPCAAYRRNDKTPLPGFEQDDYVANANFNTRTLASLLEEFAFVRRATIQLFEHFTEDEWQRRGTSNVKEITPRALAYNIADHELHHLDILQSRYLAA